MEPTASVQVGFSPILPAAMQAEELDGQIYKVNSIPMSNDIRFNDFNIFIGALYIGDCRASTSKEDLEEWLQDVKMPSTFKKIDEPVFFA